MKNVKTRYASGKSIRCFDIVERSFNFAVRVVRLCRELDKNSTSTVIARQLMRSGTSICANIEEAQAAQSKVDFAHKCNISLKEARETNYWLRLLIASEIIPEKKLLPLLGESEELCRIIATITKKSRKTTDGS